MQFNSSQTSPKDPTSPSSRVPDPHWFNADPDPILFSYYPYSCYLKGMLNIIIFLSQKNIKKDNFTNITTKFFKI